jgi:nitrite reductase/ring-hydroxylating ferredoxin subunit
VYRTGTGVDVNVTDAGQDEWTAGDRPQLPLVGAEGVYVHTDGGGVLATRQGGAWHGIGARCSHRGGPLQDGALEDGCVTCPWHQSRFRLDDGSVVDGPATAPQPVYDVRERAGRVEVRRAS